MVTSSDAIMLLKLFTDQVDGVDLGLLKHLDHLARDLQRIFVARGLLKERGVFAA